MKVLLALFVLTLIVVASVDAGEYYKVDVTRKAQDFYQDTTTRVIIKTRWCYEYVYYQEAILEWDGYSGRLIFVGNGAVCDVERVLR